MFGLLTVCQLIWVFRVKPLKARLLAGEQILQPSSNELLAQFGNPTLAGAQSLTCDVRLLLTTAWTRSARNPSTSWPQMNWPMGKMARGMEELHPSIPIGHPNGMHGICLASDRGKWHAPSRLGPRLHGVPLQGPGARRIFGLKLREWESVWRIFCIPSHAMWCWCFLHVLC